ncbi:MAG TPA: 16S rRNA (cytidine(1402)-2'-O)-methyltransferase [Alphaproteobacteria bacterium]|nr:16S rRNA (cytidine(1402)-2'-O)-methyltransferase [Alphaproteobacteria bacterium]
MPDNAKEHASGRSGSLVVVATPIGNLGDLSKRAAATLAGADLIACEDTRVTAKLLAAEGIRTPMLVYHDHNAARVRPVLIERLRQGATVALVSDAGTPLVSDPGFKLVEAALAEGIAITAVPGPSAILAALVLSGLPSDRFFFAGFLPPKDAARRTEIRALAQIPGTLIFYESATRLAKTLADLLFVLGPRRAAVARELTKRFEEVRRDRLDALVAHYAEGPPPKGEIVVLIAPPDAEEGAAATDVDLDAALAEALAGRSVREAAALVAAETGLPRRAVYARALALKAGRD